MSLKILVKLGLFPKSANQLGKQNVQKVGGGATLADKIHHTVFDRLPIFSWHIMSWPLHMPGSHQSRVNKSSESVFSARLSNWQIVLWTKKHSKLALTSTPPPRSPPHCQIGRFFRPYLTISWFKAKLNHYCAQNTLARVLTPNNTLSNIEKKWPKPFGQAFTPPPPHPLPNVQCQNRCSVKGLPLL